MLRWVFVVLILLHGLIHLMGFAKAFGYAELPQLTQPISKGTGVAWLAAALSLFITASLFVTASRVWWIAGLGAVALSQVVIVSSWTDAKWGTLANAVILAGVIYGFASRGPISFRAEYRQQVQQRLAEPVSPPLVTEDAVALLPEPVRRYVRLSGAVDQPSVHHFKVRWRGRIRATPDDPWMAFTAEQYNFIDEPSRFFSMDARRSGLPVDVLHVFAGDSATMRVRLLSLIPMVNTRGSQMRRAETVTVLNDMALMAPAALIDPAIRWDTIDARSARAQCTVGDYTISAVLHFNEAGELVDFVSEDRLAMSPDGAEMVSWRWSTPVSDYRNFGPRRVSTRGEGRWHPPEGEYVYIELELLDLEVNSKR